MASSPTVIYPLTLPALLTHVLTPQSSTAPTTLIICSSRETFLQDLLLSLQLQQGRDEQGVRQLITPTLHNLFTAQHVRVTFCASVQTLLAYLAAYAGAAPGQSGMSKRGAKEKIYLISPLRLHAPTPSFSAQGLSRTFAAAVEAASRVHAALVIAEYIGATRESNPDAREGGGEEEVSMVNEEHAQGEDQGDPWEQEVSILNVSTRRFGSGNADRAWAGRTVKAKRIAARWCQFHNLREPKERQQPG